MIKYGKIAMGTAIAASVAVIAVYIVGNLILKLFGVMQ